MNTQHPSGTEVPQSENPYLGKSIKDLDLARNTHDLTRNPVLGEYYGQSVCKALMETYPNISLGSIESRHKGKLMIAKGKMGKLPLTLIMITDSTKGDLNAMKAVNDMVDLTILESGNNEIGVEVFLQVYVGNASINNKVKEAYEGALKGITLNKTYITASVIPKTTAWSMISWFLDKAKKFIKVPIKLTTSIKEGAEYLVEKVEQLEG
jgi:hypothetical protein